MNVVMHGSMYIIKWVNEWTKINVLNVLPDREAQEAQRDRGQARRENAARNRWDERIYWINEWMNECG